MYWHVDDVAAALTAILSGGARIYQTQHDRGEGFVTAAVVDPFGNILGVMYNPHHVQIEGHVAAQSDQGSPTRAVRPGQSDQGSPTRNDPARS